MSLQGQLAIAQRKSQKHFTFCYNVADMADASDVRTAMHGNDLAKNAWLCNGYFWWSAVITVFSPNADGTVTEVKAYCRDTMRRCAWSGWPFRRGSRMRRTGTCWTS